MARKLCKSTISELMSYWGRKGGSRATQRQKDAARANLKKTPNYRKHAQLAEGQGEPRLNVVDVLGPAEAPEAAVEQTTAVVVR